MTTERRFLHSASSRLVFALALFVMPLPARVDLLYEQEPINYLSAPVHDPVARLQEKLDRGEASLTFDQRRGYLPSVLEQLKVPVSSQALVFSKTSFQLQAISAEAPRALYFNDDVDIGWV